MRRHALRGLGAGLAASGDDTSSVRPPERMSQPADLSSCIGTLSFSANLIGARTVGGRKFRARVGKGARLG